MTITLSLADRPTTIDSTGGDTMNPLSVVNDSIGGVMVETNPSSLVVGGRMSVSEEGVGGEGSQASASIARGVLRMSERLALRTTLGVFQVS